MDKFRLDEKNIRNEKIILGSVQFGLLYGINNIKGIPDKIELKSILDYAYSVGIKTIDCAEAYGNAIERIANYHAESENRFKIITKLKSLGDAELSIGKVKNLINLLSVPNLEAILLHDVNGYLNNPTLMKTLRIVKDEGLVNKIGISIYTNEQFAVSLVDKNVDIIQFPFNLLDNSALRGNIMKQAKAAEKTLHVRSVFLQGLLFKNLNILPQTFENLKPALQQIDEIASDFEISVPNLALAYALQNPRIDSVILGVDSLAQLQENIEMGNTYLPDECIKRINSIKIKDIKILNPSTWKLN